MVKTIYKAEINDHSNLGMQGAKTPTICYTFWTKKKLAEKWAIWWIRKTFTKYSDKSDKDLKENWADLGSIGVSITSEKLYGEKKKYKAYNYSGKNCL